MNTAEAASKNLDHTRDGGMYLAFVEAIDQLDGDALKTRDGMPDYWIDILDERNVASLDLPTHRIWLDCVRSDYFSGIEWRHETCRRNDDAAASRRRHQLLDLDPDQFATVLLLLSPNDGSGGAAALEQFQEGSWHEVELNSLRGLPVVAASDFDLVVAQRCYFEWQHEVAELERDVLRNVFNLDFIPDADWGERGSKPPQPRPKPSAKDMGNAHPIQHSFRR